MEMWKPIHDLEGYSISSKGRIRKDSTGQIMKTRVSSTGYIVFTVTKSVHRMVAEAFLDPPENDEANWVDHIDGNRGNVEVDNLRWVTPSENAFAFGYGNRIESRKVQIKASHIDGRILLFNSRQEVAEYFGCNDSEILYNHRYIKNSRKNRSNPDAHNKKGWIFEKVKDIV